MGQNPKASSHWRRIYIGSLEDVFYNPGTAGRQVRPLVMPSLVQSCQYGMFSSCFSARITSLCGHFSSLGDLRASDQYFNQVISGYQGLGFAIISFKGEKAIGSKSLYGLRITRSHNSSHVKHIYAERQNRRIKYSFCSKTSLFIGSNVTLIKIILKRQKRKDGTVDVV